ncbi:MAG: yrrB 4 [Planctomycetaceae bacterium]|nr:yrrB 4 [Planctomycetaceae bacterium]
MSATFSTPSRQSWIISPLADGFFLIGSAFLVGGAFLLAQAAGQAHGLAIFVLYVMATGHHLPGFLRIYSDPELFRQYRWRFIVIPVVVVGLSFLLAAYDLHALLLITFLWGLWHGMMQVYGFARIYDAKLGQVSPVMARLDWSLCLTWFLLLSFGSTFYADDFRTRAAAAGSSYLAELVLSPLIIQLLTGAACVVTVLHVGYTAWNWSQGRPVSPLKFLLLASSIGLFAVSYRLLVNDKLVGLAVWEAFHDIQYYAIVWAFTRRRGEHSPLSRWGRMLFQPQLRFVLAYLALIALYGYLDYGSRTLVDTATGDSLRPLLVASAFLHFYFDGFIWKIRRRTVQRDLNIQSAQPFSVPISPAPLAVEDRSAGLGDLVWQLACLGIPIILILGLEVDRASWERPACELVVSVFPDSAEAHRNLARLYERDNVTDYAIHEYQRAVALNPKSWQSQFRLGVLQVRTGQAMAAKQSFQAALAAGAPAEDVESNLALLEWQNREYRASLQRLKRVIEQYPQNPQLLATIATFLTTCPDPELRDPTAALACGQRALALSDESHRPEILDAIAAAQALQGDFRSAVASIKQAIHIARKLHNTRREQALARMLERYKTQVSQ